MGATLFLAGDLALAYGLFVLFTMRRRPWRYLVIGTVCGYGGLALAVWAALHFQIG